MGQPPALACVILAHNDAQHVRRLIDSLDPFPIFLHCDRATPDAVFDAMVTGLPDRCVVMNRLATGWAKWENVAAELEGYRAALSGTTANHVALFTGSDYPLASTDAIGSYLAEHVGKSIGHFRLLPYDAWGRSGGYARLRYRHWAYRKHMLRLPVPRRLPPQIVFAGGSQVKILARHHAQAVLAAADQHPQIVEFFRRSWVADETFVPSILHTPAFVEHWASEHLEQNPWFIEWGDRPQKSPQWLDLDAINELVADQDAERRDRYLFARKFNSAAPAVLDSVDRRLRGVDPTQSVEGSS